MNSIRVVEIGVILHVVKIFGKTRNSLATISKNEIREKIWNELCKTRKVGCGRWDSAFLNIRLHKDVLEGGLCLFESWYVCRFPEDCKLKSSDLKIKMLEKFNQLNS